MEFAPLPDLPELPEMQQENPLAIKNPMGLIHDDTLDTTPTSSAAAAGSGGSRGSSSAAAGGSSSPGAIGSLVALEKWAAGIVTRSTAPTTGISLEDIVLIVLGILLVAGALFSFKQTKNVVQTITKNARGAADKAVSSKLAELAA
jgi:LPXTG-motif cell wall-anchored protein